MTNRELCEKYGCCVFAKGIDPDAEASPELEEILKEFQEQSEEFDRILEERAKNTD